MRQTEGAYGRNTAPSRPRPSSPSGPPPQAPPSLRDPPARPASRLSETTKGTPPRSGQRRQAAKPGPAAPCRTKGTKGQGGYAIGSYENRPLRPSPLACRVRSQTQGTVQVFPLRPCVCALCTRRVGGPACAPGPTGRGMGSGGDAAAMGITKNPPPLPPAPPKAPGGFAVAGNGPVSPGQRRRPRHTAEALPLTARANAPENSYCTGSACSCSA